MEVQQAFVTLVTAIVVSLGVFVSGVWFWLKRFEREAKAEVRSDLNGDIQDLQKQNVEVRHVLGLVSGHILNIVLATGQHPSAENLKHIQHEAVGAMTAIRQLDMPQVPMQQF